MNAKPEWLTKLDEDYSRNRTLRNQTAELAACQQAILSSGAPKLWGRVRDYLYETIQSCTFTTSRADRSQVDHALMTISRRDSTSALAVLDVEFVAETYEIRSSMRVPISGYTPKTFQFTVQGGRVSLSEGGRPLPDNGEDVAEVACQRILEPLLRLFTS